MALTVKDRVKESTTTTGTSDFTLGGAAAGYQTFAVIGNGNTTYYAAVDQATGDWEVGIGTYSSTGPTLSRDTVLESSNSGSKVNFTSGSKDVFCTYPAERSVYLDAAGSAVTVLDVGTLGTGTANITTANITAGTVSTTPVSGNDLANKTYVDTMAASGITYHTPVKYEVPDSTGNLNATYNNGTAGVGATLTNAGTLAAFAPDGPTASPGDRILVYNQTNAYENGVYTVTTVGNGSTAWVLTRATDADNYAVKSPTGLGQGDAFFITSGNTGAGETYVCNTVGTITFGTTAITFAQISDATLYTAGTGLTLSGTEFSITPVGTAATYGSASQVPVFTTNASGQISSVTDTAISITSAAVSGLAASATTDTTNATNITSGTLPTGRLSGSYTGVTGVGTLTAGTWNGSTVGAAYGGTGQSSYTTGDLLYADGTTSLAKLADVATGNALISGGVGTAPAWGKVGLQTHVSGTLQATNGGTGATTLTGYVYGNGTGAMTASTSIPNSATTATSSNTASAIVARDASGNFSAGTITASLSGNASTATSATSATTATNLAGGTAGAVPYQTGSGATSFSAAGTSGQVLQSNGTSAPSWTTLPTTGDGTLTLATAGTGLSGSATFTANQSGNSTFTVTSNATSGNTASTIVARDASGNFSAGTITAALTGTASGNLPLSGGTLTGNVSFAQGANINFGTATTESGPWTLSVIGSGGSTPATKGTGFGRNLIIKAGNSDNGSGLAGGDLFLRGGDPTAPATVYGDVRLANLGGQVYLRSVGAIALGSDNYTSYAPSLTGSGASGTWNISTTGTLTTSAPIYRSAAGAGYLNGQYGSYESVSTTGAIYSIGGSYVPTSTSYNNMYGVAYAYSGPGRPMGNVAGIPSDQWAFVGLEAGTPKWALNTSNGSGYFSGNLYVNGGTQVVYNSGTWGISITGNASSVGGFTIDAQNSRNMRIYPQASGGDVGLLGVDSSGNFKYQIYGNGSSYGFLDSTWGSWDLRKEVAGELFIRVAGIERTVINSGNISGQSVASATTATNQSGGTVSATTGDFSNRVNVTGTSTATSTLKLENSSATSGDYPMVQFRRTSTSSMASENVGRIDFSRFRTIGSEENAGYIQVLGSNSTGLATMQFGAITGFNFLVAGTSYLSLSGGTTRCTIAGNTSITQTANDSPLYVGNDNSAYYAAVLRYTAATGGGFGVRSAFASVAPNSTSYQFYSGADSSATRFIVYSNGGIANYQANNVNLSDRREKKDFAPAENYLDKLCAIPVQTFLYKDQPEEDQVRTLGVVAQDVQAVAPELVTESNWAGLGEPERLRLTIYQTDLQYAMMKSIQELKAQLDRANERIAALEAAKA